MCETLRRRERNEREVFLDPETESTGLELRPDHFELSTVKGSVEMSRNYGCRFP